MILLVILFVLLFTRSAWCYIDPGTGSYLFQILIAAAVAVGFALKMFWSKIVNFFRRIFNRRQDASGD